MYPISNTSIPVLSQAEVSYRIDKFVDDVLSSKAQAYTLPANPLDPYRMRSLGLDLQYLRQMIGLFDGRVDYDYSENLNLFIDACHDIRLECDGYRYICPDSDARHGFLSEPEAMNVLVDRIRELSREGDYTRRSTDRRYAAKQQVDDVRAFVMKVTEQYSKTLVVRVNLYYRIYARQRLRG